MSIGKTMTHQDASLNMNQNQCAIISLTPKERLFIHLKEISEDLLNVTEDKIEPYLDQNLLESHTVPVCIPLCTTPHDLTVFIKNNSTILFDFMLTAWPFPVEQWGFSCKNFRFLQEFVDINYFPLVCKGITKPYRDTMDLAVTFATPTPIFIDYIAECIGSKKLNLSPEEMIEFQFLIATGIAIVTNNIEKMANQSTQEFYLAMNDSRNYLASLNNKSVETLFSFYFKSKEEFPPDNSNEFLNVWFNTKTYLGLYMLTDLSITKKYA